MTDTINVYLITGFLGSGKTVYLNRIIDKFPKNKKLTILMNEFGEIGIDGTLVEGDELDMMEISKGSIFCVCVKTDFIKGLYELKNTVKPDVLIIESTGVANPSDLKRDLRLPIFNNSFHFAEQFCVIDAAHFLDAYKIYASLEKQIASSTVFIINKTDLATPERIEETKKVIHQFHPDPSFFETTYADIPFEQFFLEEMTETTDHVVTAAGERRTALSEEELDQFIDDLLDSPELEITPPDLLMSVTYEWRGDDLERVNKVAESLPSTVVRAKGFLKEENRVHLFNYVMGDWSIEESGIPEDRIQHMNVVVFIGPPESMEEIEQACQTGEWANMGTFQPFSETEDESV